MEELEIEALRIQKVLNANRLKNKEANRKDSEYLERFQAVTNKLNAYLNKNFYQALCNLKADRSNCVADFLEGYNIKDRTEAGAEDEGGDNGDGDDQLQAEIIGQQFLLQQSAMDSNSEVPLAGSVT